jgi:glycosyltransferase involved in cell wall biosynthesis
LTWRFPIFSKGFNKMLPKGLHLGIDASNIRQGGGVTHLSQLLSAASPTDSGINHVTLWACAETVSQLPALPWLTKLSPSWVDAGNFKRMLGQQLLLRHEIARRGCEVLFSPGGTVPFYIRIPVVTMSQNMLPFEPEEAKRFGRWSWMRLKMWLLRQSQSRSFRKADGLIFLSQYARNVVCRWLEQGHAQVQALQTLIPHGIEPRFAADPKPQRSFNNFSFEKPFTLLYVSILMPYKHQIEVARAASVLRQTGCPVRVKFIGADCGRYGRQFRKTLRLLDPREEFLIWPGGMPFSALHSEYQDADGFIFASSCENLPNILIEAMSAGLPIACSKSGPMPEVLGNAGIYFDPLQPQGIAEAILTLVISADLRGLLAAQSKELSRAYSWQRCAKDTFEFIAAVAASRIT